MNPLRKRFFGDTAVAQRYTGEAMGLLDAVYDQMRLGGTSQLTMHRVLGNGVEIRASSVFGQDEIQIHVKPTAGKKGGGVREYCVWEGDSESFTDPVQLIRHYGPYTGVGSRVHFGGQTSGSNAISDPFANKNYIYAPDALEAQVGDYDIPGIISAGVVSAPDPFGDGGVFKIYHQSPSTDPFAGGQVMGTGLDGEFQGIDRFIPDAVLGGGVNACPTPSPAYNRRNWALTTTTPNRLHFTDPSGTDLSSVDSRGGLGDIFPTRSGDILQVEAPDIPAGITTFGVRRYGIAGARSVGDAFFPMPEGVVATDLIRLVAQNDSQTIWMAVVDQLGDPFAGLDFKLFQLRQGEWHEINVTGGFPKILVNQYGQQQFYNIAHDPVTDAIAVAFMDSSNPGAWIFNGKDCMNIPLGPFFRKFNSTRIDFSLTPADGEVYNYNNAFVSQFFNARLYIRYTSFIGPYDFNGQNYFSVTGASYKVGRLLQKKQVSVE